jgi:3',5'-cyclic-AMP phosphodiesterase
MLKNWEPYRIAHLTDTHVVPAGEDFRGLDTGAHLAAALAIVEAAGGPLDAILLTGDLVERGGTATYRLVRELVEPVAARLGVPAVYLPGNHDDPTAFAEVLAGGDTVLHVRGLRIVTLDSSVPGSAAGDLTPAQLDWLADELATPAEHGTLLALHHPPLPGTSPLIERVALAPAARHALGDVVAGTDVRIIAAGHYHQPVGGVLRGIPVWVAGALAYTSDAYPPPGLHRGLPLSSFARVEIHPDAAFGVFQPVLDRPAVYTQQVHTPTERSLR